MKNQMNRKRVAAGKIAYLLILCLLVQTAAPLSAAAAVREVRETASAPLRVYETEELEAQELGDARTEAGSGAAEQVFEEAGYDSFIAETVKETGTELTADIQGNSANIAELPARWYGLLGGEEEPAPGAYDARDIQTAVKDQGSYNTCWAFSTTAAAEASMIMQGYESASVDYSEHGLAYFMYNSPENDPLGLTGQVNKEGEPVWDRNVLPKGKTYHGAGGNPVYALMMLSGWQGMQDEERIPYGEIGNGASYEDELCYDNKAVLRQGFIYNLNKNPELVKRAIMEYGSATLEYGGTHSMLIVGWDDDFICDVPVASPSVASPSSADPGSESKGAWLVKNSYGEGDGEGGYRWISYADKGIGDNSVVMEFMPAGTYDHNYHYDGTAGTRTNVYEGTKTGTLASGGSAANHFKNTGDSAQLLEAVSIGVKTADVDYSIQIYTKKGMMTGPEDSTATPAFETPVTGSTEASGIYCVELPEPVYIPKGAEFSVVVTLTHHDEEKRKRGDAIELFTDKSVNMVDGGKTVLTFINETAQRQSYVKTLAGGSWADWARTKPASASWTFRIKAFTSDTEERPEEKDPYESIYPKKIFFDPEEADITVGKQRRLVLKFEPADRTLSGLTFTWSSDDTDVATVAPYKGGTTEAVVKAKSEGFCYIYASCRQRPQLTARFFVEVTAAQGGGTGGGGTGGGGTGGGGTGGGGGNPLGPGAEKQTAGALYSARWYEAADGNWYLKGKDGLPVKSVWVCDDTNASTRGNVWYLVGESGKMESSPLMQDASGNYYSLEMRHDGYFGMLRWQNGTYDLGNGKKVYLEFEQAHNGAFGAIRNAEGIEALKAQYGVSVFPVSATQFLYTSSLEQ